MCWNRILVSSILPWRLHCIYTRLDWINEELHRQNRAVHTFHDVDMAMREYARVFGHSPDPLGSEPQLSDFYTPSEDQKDREITLIIPGMAATGLVAYKLAK